MIYNLPTTDTMKKQLESDFRTMITGIGTSASDPALFNGEFVVTKQDMPFHLFVDSDDNILVADNDNNRFQVFHQNGDHKKSIGTGQLSSPRGVCMDREGRIIISEGSGANRISIF